VNSKDSGPLSSQTSPWHSLIICVEYHLENRF
jgi:hypothetical protein